ATSNRVTGRIATRPTRNPSAFSPQPTPSAVTTPAPVTTTRAGGLGGCFGGKSTVGLAISQKLNEVFCLKSNAASDALTSGEKKHEVDSLSSMRNGGEVRGDEASYDPALCVY